MQTIVKIQRDLSRKLQVSMLRKDIGTSVIATAGIVRMFKHVPIENAGN